MRNLSRIAAVMFVAVAVFVAPAARPSPTLEARASAATTYQVSAWTYTGEYATSLPMAVSAHAIDEVQGDWWYSKPDGSLSSNTPADFVPLAHTDGLRAIATVINEGFRPAVADSILSSARRTTRQVNALVNQCVAQGFDGIDIDWENMYARERDPFSNFIQQLATALHAKHKTLGIAVYAKTSEPGTWHAQIAENFAALGASVDEFQVMTYDEHGGWSGPGPIADPSWMNKAIRFAQTEVAPDKVWMGVPFYGYDWGKTGASTVTYARAQELIATYHPRIVRTPSMEERFTYRSGGVKHIVYFQDRRSIAAKLNVVVRDNPGIAGIAIWSLGGDYQGYWNAIARKLK
jgi:spore germination protein YaaH